MKFPIKKNQKISFSMESSKNQKEAFKEKFCLFPEFAEMENDPLFKLFRIVGIVFMRKYITNKRYTRYISYLFL